MFQPKTVSVFLLSSRIDEFCNKKLPRLDENPTSIFDVNGLLGLLGQVVPVEVLPVVLNRQIKVTADGHFSCLYHDYHVGLYSNWQLLWKVMINRTHGLGARPPLS
jgi:hypothetical protein